MDRQAQQRLIMVLTGAGGGLATYALAQISADNLLPERVVLVLTAFAMVFTVAMLALMGALALARSVLMSAGLALLVALALGWASLRFDTLAELKDMGLTVLILVFIPLPFILAAHGPGWRDYPTLFLQAWTVVVRYAAAWLFVGVVWGVLMLSAAVLQTVDITLLEDLLRVEGVASVLTGAALGLGMAVVTELVDLISPYLALRLLRLLVPVVLVVMAVFLLAVPFKGLTALFGGLTSAGVLLAMVAVAATLVTTALDASDDEATDSRFLAVATRILALILLFPAVLGAVAVGMRVQQYGWTPDRVDAAIIAVLALGYGVLYCLAALQGAGWMARIRRANIWMALAVLAVAVQSFIPLVNAERIAAQDQLARLRDGRLTADTVDIAALARWGRPGDAVLREMADLAKDPAFSSLAKRLAETDDAGKTLLATRAEVIAALVQDMPLRPETAVAMRDKVLAAVSTEQAREWLQGCQQQLPTGGSGCVLLAADFLPDAPGDEAVVLMMTSWGGVLRHGFDANGFELRVILSEPTGDQSIFAAMITAAQAGAPVMAPLAVNTVDLAGSQLFLLP